MSIDEAIKVLKKDVKCIEEDGYKCIETNIDCRDCEFWVTPDERRKANRTLVDYFKNENKED